MTAFEAAVLAGVAGLAALLVAMFVFLRRSLSADTGQEQQALAAMAELDKRAALAEQEAARLREVEQRYEALRREHAELAALNRSQEAMVDQFKLLSQDVLSRQGEQFGKQSRDVLGRMIDPLKTKIAEFEAQVRTANKETVEERTVLKEQIRALFEQEKQMRAETLNLTRALKGDSQARGAWGEAVLTSILDSAGLREGQEYVTQQSHTQADGRRLRPDVIVNLPNDEYLVIDSKVALPAYTDYMGAETDEDRQFALARHAASLRNHVNDLTKKSYQDLPGTRFDYVLMFVPVESALSVAMQAAPELLDHAWERGVMIVGPHNLMIALRSVAQIWRIERQNRNAEAIADRAGKLLDKFAGFHEDMKKVGERLDQARDTHAAAMGKLADGRGNLLSQMHMLEKLGAKGKKALPGSAGAEDAEADEDDGEDIPGAASD